MSDNKCVYILTNYRKTVLYIGVTSDLKRRIYEHRQGQVPGFTKKYHLKYLVYYELFESVIDAIQREKSLKGKTRKKKNNLIEELNSSWRDLSLDIF